MSKISADSISSRSGGNISINNDVVVESNITINSTGINAVGVVTATGFVGSGAQLSGLPESFSVLDTFLFG